MTLIKDISSDNWSLSVSMPGDIVKDVADIIQCAMIILNTDQGSDPLRPEFGMPLFNHLDRPVTTIPTFIKAMADALEIWETRMTVKRISYKIEANGKVTFSIDWYINIIIENNPQITVSYDFFK